MPTPPTPDQRTPMYRLADVLLDGQLRAFVEGHRAAGRSWRWIARELWDQTDRQVDVTQETLRTWFPEEGRAA